MHRSLCTLLLLALAITVSAAPAAAEVEAEKAWRIDGTLGIFSDYNFRGASLYDGASIQPGLKGSYEIEPWGRFGAAGWMHFSAEGDRDSERFTEFDATLSYERTMGIVTLGAGHSWYTFTERNQAPLNDTAEYYVLAALATVLNPVAAVYFDYREYDLQYYELSLSQQLALEQLGEGFNLTPFVTFGFASHAKKLYESDGFVQATYGVSFGAKLGDVSVTPSVSYTNGVDDATIDDFWFGTTFSYSY